MYDQQHWCSSFDIASTLVEAGADVNAVADTTMTPLQRGVESAEHHEHMRIRLFKNRSMPSAKALDMSPEHPGGQCASCDMSVSAKEIGFYCSSCEALEGVLLCCVCFLCNSWCSDPTHRWTSSWVHPDSCAEDVQPTLLERNALKPGSIVALLKSRAAMTSEEIRRHSERSLGQFVLPPKMFKWLAASGAIRSADQALHERWLSVLDLNETSSEDEDEPSLDCQPSYEIMPSTWQGNDFPPKGNITELEQHKHGFSTTIHQLKMRAKRKNSPESRSIVARIGASSTLKLMRFKASLAPRRGRSLPLNGNPRSVVCSVLALARGRARVVLVDTGWPASYASAGGVRVSWKRCEATHWDANGTVCWKFVVMCAVGRVERYVGKRGRVM
jgi:hypothetical protein